MAAWFVLPLGCLSMPLCLEMLVTFLSGLSRKLDVFLSASTSCLTDIMKLRSNLEPGRDEQRFPAYQKNESWDIPLPARWEIILSYPDDRYLSTHITDTCCQNNCSCWWFQRCYSDCLPTQIQAQVIWRPLVRRQVRRCSSSGISQ